MSNPDRAECPSVGCEILDAQHAKLFALFRELRAVPRDADPLTEYRLACKALHELVDYTRVHFGEEERLLEEAGYPHLDEHRAEHDRFLKRVSELEESMHFGEGVTSLNIFCSLLEEWWTNHILKSDRQYVPYLQCAS
ncbi:MAG: bacteriohemerythrin [Sulfuricellaceae bacterium]|jgi:hemerythrin